MCDYAFFKTNNLFISLQDSVISSKRRTATSFNYK